jgi:hypothetical protein
MKRWPPIFETVIVVVVVSGNDVVGIGRVGRESHRISAAMWHIVLVVGVVM